MFLLCFYNYDEIIRSGYRVRIIYNYRTIFMHALKETFVYTNLKCQTSIRDVSLILEMFLLSTSKISFRCLLGYRVITIGVS